MKNTVIEFFQNLPESKTDQFNKAFELYRQTPTKSESVERVLNASGYSEMSLNNLLYDLQKLHGITDVEKLPIETVEEKPDSTIEILEKVIYLTVPEFPLWLDNLKESGLQISELIEVAATKENDLAILALNEISIFKDKVDFLDLLVEKSIEEIKIDFAQNITPPDEHFDTALEFAISINNEKAVEKIKEIIESLKAPMIKENNLSTEKDDSFKIENEELKNQNDELNVENEELNLKNDELGEENENLKTKLDESKSLPKINVESLRVEFPFLNEKECPNELKILVADKITVWNEYLILHDSIVKSESGEITLSPDELETKAKRSVECFDENQKIYEELNAFKETGEILGKHPIFKKLQLTREVEAMTLDEKIKYKSNTAKFFSVNKKDLKAAEKAKDVERIQLLNDRITERAEKLVLVNKELGVK